MEKKQPKVSVIMPSLNMKKYITQSIESVINQTLTDIEILCIDAGSDDGTLEILKKYAEEDERVHVFLSNKKSYGAQVNQGLNNAKGEYVSIIETDDYIQENMLESLYNLTQIGYIDIVKGNFYHVYDNVENIIKADTAKRSLANLDKAFKINNQPIFLEGHPSIWSAIYKRSFLLNNEIMFLEEEGGAWVDNPFFYETALKAQTIRYTDTPYYYYRESNENSSTNNLTNLSIPAKRIKDIFEVLKDNEWDNPEIKILFYNRIFRYIEIIIENQEKSGEELDYEATKDVHEILRNVDITYVQENLSTKNKRIYYKFASPLILAKFENN
ncbi:glycosyltransferase family 2 protein [Methanosphaera sp. ISO3-F5]|uniref:glycosyltransferase family 2 protein n=1 Tax=Methanosphaera sp. ISO3-F5 TaxID=1452353 RepID=UPI002B25DFFD|nr:glycosyltransferase family 2 protein [Methanosphaera sp. ISO3-F5]WQH63481.1 glycosyltransferase family 2 protein [Methanosphaera sp. ISO3-F5]